MLSLINLAFIHVSLIPTKSVTEVKVMNSNFFHPRGSLGLLFHRYSLLVGRICFCVFGLCRCFAITAKYVWNCLAWIMIDLHSDGDFPKSNHLDICSIIPTELVDVTDNYYTIKQLSFASLWGHSLIFMTQKELDFTHWRFGFAVVKTQEFAKFNKRSTWFRIGFHDARHRTSWCSNPKV